MQVGLWDVTSKTRLHSLIGHRSEISSCVFNHESSLVLTGTLEDVCTLVSLARDVGVYPSVWFVAECFFFDVAEALFKGKGVSG